MRVPTARFAVMKRCGFTRSIDDVGAVEDRQRAGVAHAVGEPGEVRMRDVGQSDGSEVDVAELHNRRPQPERGSVGADVADVGERDQQTASGRTRGVDLLRHLSESERSCGLREHSEYVDAAAQRLDRVGFMRRRCHVKSLAFPCTKTARERHLRTVSTCTPT